MGEQEWFAQSLNLLISIPPVMHCVLIWASKLQDGDCVKLASEITTVTGTVKRPHGANSLLSTPQKVHKFSYTMSPGTVATLPLALTG